jgi:hypothetical protein
MHQFLSSIFSFRTLRLSGADGRGVGLALVAALAILALAEAGSRWALASLGGSWQYWDPLAAVKFEGYLDRTVAPDVPQIMLAGDSTALRNFDPLALAEGSPRPIAAWNLAWMGNFPLAFQESTLPLVEDSRTCCDVVVVSFIPVSMVSLPGVRESEAGILSAAVCRRAAGARLVSDYLWSARVCPALLYLKEMYDSDAPETLIQQRGFMPFEGSRTGQAFLLDRLQGQSDLPRELDPRRLRVLDQLANATERHGARLVVMIPPTLLDHAYRMKIADLYLAALEAFSARRSVVVLDWRSAPFLTREHFHDGNHLNSQGAAELSRELAKELQRRGLLERGTTFARP